MAPADSKSWFSDRVRKLGLGAHEERIKDAGWTTMSELAFDTSYTPGGNEEVFLKDVVTKALGSPDHADKKHVRRLFTEAYTLAAGDLGRLTSASGEDVARKVPTVERQERRKAAQDDASVKHNSPAAPIFS